MREHQKDRTTKPAGRPLAGTVTCTPAQRWVFLLLLFLTLGPITSLPLCQGLGFFRHPLGEPALGTLVGGALLLLGKLAPSFLDPKR